MSKPSAQFVYDYLRQNYPANVLDWVKHEDWRYVPDVPLSKIKMARRPGGRNMDKVKGIAEAIRKGEKMEPVVLVETKDGYKIADGYHRTLAFEHAGKKTIPALVAVGVHDKGDWDVRMHEAKLNLSLTNIAAFGVQSLEGRDTLLEQLAQIEHDQWVAWSKSVAHEVSPERRQRWASLWVPYSHLSESEKEKDRERARRVLSLIKGVRTTAEMSVEQRLERAERLLGALTVMSVKPNKDGDVPKDYPKRRSEYADPQDKAYPLDTPAHVRDAASRFGEFKDRYSKKKRDEIARRIDEAEKRLKIGKYRTSESTETMSASDAAETILDVLKHAYTDDSDTEVTELTTIIRDMLQSERNPRTYPEQFDVDSMVGEFMRELRGYGSPGPR